MISQPAAEPPQQKPRGPFDRLEEFHRDARALAARLADEGPFDIIVALRVRARSAAILARELGIRFIDTVCVWSYQHAIKARRAH